MSGPFSYQVSGPLSVFPIHYPSSGSFLLLWTGPLDSFSINPMLLELVSHLAQLCNAQSSVLTSFLYNGRRFHFVTISCFICNILLLCMFFHVLLFSFIILYTYLGVQSLVCLLGMSLQHLSQICQAFAACLWYFTISLELPTLIPYSCSPSTCNMLFCMKFELMTNY